MQLHSCKVRLSGSLYNEVTKRDVTVPEIVVLKHIHGDDAVVEIKSLGREAFDIELDEDGNQRKVLRTDKAERARLRAIYDPNDRFLTKEVFGVNQPLPQVIEGLDGAIVPDVPARRRRTAKPTEDLDAMVAA